MLRWALIFLVVALIAAVFALGGVAEAFKDLARVLFWTFLVVFLVVLGAGLFRR